MAQPDLLSLLRVGAVNNATVLLKSYPNLQLDPKDVFRGLECRYECCVPDIAHWLQDHHFLTGTALPEVYLSLDSFGVAAQFRSWAQGKLSPVDVAELLLHKLKKAGYEDGLQLIRNTCRVALLTRDEIKKLVIPHLHTPVLLEGFRKELFPEVQWDWHLASVPMAEELLEDVNCSFDMVEWCYLLYQKHFPPCVLLQRLLQLARIRADKDAVQAEFRLFRDGFAKQDITPIYLSKAVHEPVLFKLLLQLGWSWDEVKHLDTPDLPRTTRFLLLKHCFYPTSIGEHLSKLNMSHINSANSFHVYKRVLEKEDNDSLAWLFQHTPLTSLSKDSVVHLACTLLTKLPLHPCLESFHDEVKRLRCDVNFAEAPCALLLASVEQLETLGLGSASTFAGRSFLHLPPEFVLQLWERNWITTAQLEQDDTKYVRYHFASQLRESVTGLAAYMKRCCTPKPPESFFLNNSCHILLELCKIRMPLCLEIASVFRELCHHYHWTADSVCTATLFQYALRRKNWDLLNTLKQLEGFSDIPVWQLIPTKRLKGRAVTYLHAMLCEASLFFRQFLQVVEQCYPGRGLDWESDLLKDQLLTVLKAAIQDGYPAVVCWLLQRLEPDSSRQTLQLAEELYRLAADSEMGNVIQQHFSLVTPDQLRHIIVTKNKRWHIDLEADKDTLKTFIDFITELLELKEEEDSKPSWKATQLLHIYTNKFTE